jgi:phosphoserine phosphatase RsbU/P
MSGNTSPLILVVDDDVITNSIIESILRHEGFQTISAFEVSSGELRARTESPDIILLDIALPDGNGIDLCHRLQSSSPTAQIPVIFLSSYDDVNIKVQAFEAGGVDYISKPVEPAEIIARVRTHLRLRNTYQMLVELQSERIQQLVVAQEAIMPQPADLPEARFAIALNQVLKAGGDFYDVIPIGYTIVDYLVADVSGHDIGASFWTAALKTLLVAYAKTVNSPRQILQSINDALFRVLPSGVYVTMIYARLNRRSGQLVVVSAGHPPMIAIRAQSHGAEVFYQEGDVVGAFHDAVFHTTELQVERGDRLFLYTDGLIEIAGTREEGIQRLVEACGRCNCVDLQEALIGIMQSVVGSRVPQDDIVLMGVEV